MSGMGPLPLTWHNALTAWQWGPFPLCSAVVLVVLAYLYLRGEWALASRGRRWRGRRTAAFLAGLLAIEVALQSPVATFTGTFFQAHIVQHLLLMVVAPPLLALGAPSTLLLQSASRATKKRWLNVLRSRPFAVVSHPVLVWFFYFGAMFAFFLTPLVNYAMHRMDVMDVMNLLFLLSGTLYWWPLVGVDPVVHWRMGYGARIANLALGVPFEAFLGVAIMSDHQPVASMYSLASTHAGGALLWAATELSTFAGLAPVFLQWLRADERAAARADARAEAAAGAGSPVDLLPAASLAAQPAGPGMSPLGGAFRPLLQPGNSSWEAMWRAKAGFVPRPGRPAPSDGGADGTAKRAPGS
jgi:putative membrane protein